MNKKLLGLLILLCIAAFSFAQGTGFPETVGIEVEMETEVQEEEILEAEAQEADSEDADPEVSYPVEVPDSILNNQYYLESIRLNEQAKIAFEEGDYDASAAYSERAAEYARLSDEYVNMKLAEAAFLRAHSRYTWATSVGAATRYPAQYQAATAAYNEAVAENKAENWIYVFEASNRVLAALADVKGPDGESGAYASALPPRPSQAQGTLPAQYTIRQWASTGDCFSTIASWSWVYGDAYKWRELYEANKHKLPNPNNPHLMLPGMILDIPSLQGEKRSGMWDPSAQY